MLSSDWLMKGVFAKNTSLETKFPSPFDSGNCSSLDLYFSQIPLPNMIYLNKNIHIYFFNLSFPTWLLFYHSTKN